MKVFILSLMPIFVVAADAEPAKPAVVFRPSATVCALLLKEDLAAKEVVDVATELAESSKFGLSRKEEYRSTGSLMNELNPRVLIPGSEQSIVVEFKDAPAVGKAYSEVGSNYLNINAYIAKKPDKWSMESANYFTASGQIFDPTALEFLAVSAARRLVEGPFYSSAAVDNRGTIFSVYVSHFAAQRKAMLAHVPHEILDTSDIEQDQLKSLVGKTVSTLSTRYVDHNNDGVYYSIGKVVGVRGSVIEIENGQTQYPQQRFVNIKRGVSLAILEPKKK